MMDENNESFRSLSLSPKRFPHIMNHKKTKRTYPAPFAVSTFTCSLKHSAHVTCPLAHSITSQSPNSVSSEQQTQHRIFFLLFFFFCDFERLKQTSLLSLSLSLYLAFRVSFDGEMKLKRERERRCFFFFGKMVRIFMTRQHRREKNKIT